MSLLMRDIVCGNKLQYETPNFMQAVEFKKVFENYLFFQSFLSY